MKKSELVALVAELSRKLDRLDGLAQKVERLSVPPAAKLETVFAIKNLIDAKRHANRREIYLKSLKWHLDRFAKNHPDLSLVTTSDMENFLSGFKGAYCRQTWLNRVSTLFSFSVRRGWLKENPCSRIDRPTIDRAVPVVLTVEQSGKLIASVPANCRAYLALALFAGIRPDEVLRLKWADVNLETGTVQVDGKTRRRRHVPLEPIAVQLLSRCERSEGALAPSRSTVRRWKRRARKLIGGKWTQDILRHTAASYLLAKYQDAGKVAFWLGNSPQILMQHYAKPIPASDCERFWNLHQTKAKKASSTQVLHG